MTRYQITGRHEETGVRAKESQEVKTPEEAAQRAKQHGVSAEEVHAQDADSAERLPGTANESPSAIPAEELIEKTGRMPRQRVALGWALFLVGVPLSLWIASLIAHAGGFSAIGYAVLPILFGIVALLAVSRVSGRTGADRGGDTPGRTIGFTGHDPASACDDHRSCGIAIACISIRASPGSRLTSTVARAG